MINNTNLLFNINNKEREIKFSYLPISLQLFFGASSPNS